MNSGLFSNRRHVAVALLLVLAFLAGVGWSAKGIVPGLLDGGQICRGVSVGGVDVGGMTVSEARELLLPHVTAYENDPITLVLDGETWRVSPSQLGTSVEFEAALGAAYHVGRTGSLLSKLRQRAQVGRTGLDIPWTVVVDEERLRDLVFNMAQVATVEPRDAKLVITEDDRVVIEPSEAGRRLLPDELISALRSATLSGGNRKIDLPVEPVPPAVTTAQLEARGIRRRISQYSTKFNATNTNRTQNIRLGAKILDGVVLAPGEILSFNDVVGPRTPERGFLEADVIFNAELVPGIGGGICQVSTTLYNAALLANMQAVSRVNHSLPSTYVPLGRDATVSYGTIDLKIKNTTPHHVLLRASVNDDTLTFKVYGDLPEDLSVSIETEILEKIEPGVIERVDPESPAGTRVVAEKGSPGYRVAVWRVVRLAGNEVHRELLSRDRYKPQPTVIKVGTAPALPAYPANRP
ncbi:MAG: VanW family protein [Firmicutes bacterium]|jgi:vancomycin resistance protein YoaR|nr:VanW family protein [Bacillota bacterium]